MYTRAQVRAHICGPGACTHHTHAHASCIGSLTATPSTETVIISLHCSLPSHFAVKQHIRGTACLPGSGTHTRRPSYQRSTAQTAACLIAAMGRHHSPAERLRRRHTLVRLQHLLFQNTALAQYRLTSKWHGAAI